MSELKQLQNRQKALNDSINLGKIEEEKKRKELETMSFDIDIRKNELMSLEKEVEAMSQKLKEKQNEFEAIKPELVKMKKEMSLLSEDYKNENNRLEELFKVDVVTRKKNIKDIESEISILTAVKEKNKKESDESAAEKIASDEEYKNSLSRLNSFNLLIDGFIIRKNDLEKNITELEENEKNLSSSINILNEKILILNESERKNNGFVSDAKNEINRLDNIILEKRKEIETVEEKFNTISRNASFLIDKESYLKEQENYIKEQFKKVGRSYEPFKNNNV
jgi:chromosome segregation ATPase